MSFGKVVANAGSHRILYALSQGAQDSKELKNIVGAINSVARFEGEYMARLVNSGYIKRKGQHQWALTEAGKEKLEELGPATGVRRKNQLTKYALLMDRPIYRPQDELKPPQRPGSDQFLKYPSRIGKKLYYRDGTIKEIE